jgi:hypothetical protein
MATKGLWGYKRYETFEWGALWGQPDLGMAIAPALVFNFPDGLPEDTQPIGPETTVSLNIQDALENYVAGSGKLYYRLNSNDPFTETTVTHQGGDLFEAVIPNTKPGDEPEFYFSAEGDGGTTVYSPFNAPTKTYGFNVCIMELMLEDDFETDTGWTVTSFNVDSGEWERADPVGTGAQPENDHSPNGTHCFVTGAAGGASDDNDLDGGPTLITSPSMNLAGSDAYISFYVYFHHSDTGAQNPLEVQVSSSGIFWAKVMNIEHAPAWTEYSFRVSDFITPTATVYVRFSAMDKPDDDIVEALVDDFRVERFNFDPSLWADAYSIPVSAGATIPLSLDAGGANAGRTYLMLGSMSGTLPGHSLPGGSMIPVNWDYFTDLVLSLLNTAVFQNFMGNLNGSGQASASLNTFGPLDPILIGETAHFAYTLGNPFDYVSNAIPVKFDP